MQLKPPEYYEQLYENLNQRFSVSGEVRVCDPETVTLAPPPAGDPNAKLSIKETLEISTYERHRQHVLKGSKLASNQASRSAKARHAERRDKVKSSDCPKLAGRKHHFKKIGFDRYGQQKYRCTACMVGYTESKT